MIKRALLLLTIPAVAHAASMVSWVAQVPTTPAAGQGVTVWIDSDTAFGETVYVQTQIGSTYTNVAGTYDVSFGGGADWRVDLPGEPMGTVVAYQLYVVNQPADGSMPYDYTGYLWSYTVGSPIDAGPIDAAVPDATTPPKPDATPPRPDATLAKPDATPAKPDATVTPKPDAAPKTADASPTAADASPTAADASPTALDASLARPDASLAAPDAAGPDAGTTQTQGSACGCRVGGESTTAWPLALFALGAVLATRRRRR